MDNKPKPEEMTYEEAFGELDAILANIQSDKCDIDKLAQLTKRATQLLGACRQRLTTTEEELRDILEALKQ